MSRLFTFIAIIVGFILVLFVTSSYITFDTSSKFSQQEFNKTIELKDATNANRVNYAYSKVFYSFESNDYKIDFTYILNNGSNELVIYLIPHSNNQIATDINDSNDKTSIVLKKENSIYFSTKTNEIYANKALTFGLNPNKIGFIYINIPFASSGAYEVIITNYQDNEIFKDTLNLVKQTEEEIINDQSYLSRYTADYISEVMNLDKTLLNQSIMNVTLYLIVVAVLDLGIIITKQYLSRKK